jgi:hypothetical protein
MGKKRKLKFSHESKGLSDSSSDRNNHVSSYVYKNKIKIVLPLSRNNNHQERLFFRNSQTVSLSPVMLMHTAVFRIQIL